MERRKRSGGIRMTIEEMKKRKIELGYTNKQLAMESGVPIGTLQKIFGGSTTAPRKETIEALEKALMPRNLYKIEPPEDAVVREASSYQVGQNTAKKEKLYTLEDYMALPDDQRVELIDGKFYEMNAPTSTHQGIAGYIHAKLLEFIYKNGGTCFPMISPVDVQLDEDEYTIVQPDVLVICDRSRILRPRIFGAPDFVLEILSPSTRQKDQILKLMKYSYAGVREYWIIDPDKKRLVQHDLENNGIPRIYTFEEKVPVLIWEGQCEIDLQDMFEKISFLWDN